MGITVVESVVVARLREVSELIEPVGVLLMIPRTEIEGRVVQDFACGAEKVALPVLVVGPIAYRIACDGQNIRARPGDLFEDAGVEIIVTIPSGLAGHAEAEGRVPGGRYTDRMQGRVTHDAIVIVDSTLEPVDTDPMDSTGLVLFHHAPRRLYRACCAGKP